MAEDNEQLQLVRGANVYNALDENAAPPEVKGHRKPGKTPPFVFLAVTMSVIGGFLFGYDCGVVSGAMVVIRDDVKLKVNPDWQALLVSITVAAAALFSLVGGVTNDYFGRKPTTIISSFLFTVGSIILGAAPNRIGILIGRIIVGAAIGLSSMTIPSYVAETSPVHIRGTMVTLFQLMITIGFFAAGVLDGAFSYIKNGSWRYMFGVAAIPALFQMIGFCFMPESPRWLAIHGKKDRAYQVLLKLTKDADESKEELEAICESQRHADTERAALGDRNIIVAMFQSQPVRRALFIGCGLQMFQQLCGINTVMYYSASIVKMGGIRDKSAEIWFTALTSGVNMLMTLPGLYLVEKLGRKLLMLISMAGVILSCILLAIGFILIRHAAPATIPYSPSGIPGKAAQCLTGINNCDDCSYVDDCGYCYTQLSNHSYQGSCVLRNTTDDEFSAFGPCSYSDSGHDTGSKYLFDHGFCPTPYAFLPILGMVLYLCSFSCGFGPVPWTINAEIYPHWARSAGNAIATATNWGFNLIIASTFLRLAGAISRQGAFFLYAAITTVGFVIFLLVLPETKDQTLEEVEEDLKGPLIILFKRPGDSQRSESLQGSYDMKGMGHSDNAAYIPDEKF